MLQLKAVVPIVYRLMLCLFHQKSVVVLVYIVD